jgi:hypothetical protein
MPKPTFRCPCGARLAEPIPKVCPNCHAEIQGVRHRSRNWIFTLATIVGMFVALLLLILFLQKLIAQ